jgi:hypothetical protein
MIVEFMIETFFVLLPVVFIVGFLLRAFFPDAFK